MRLRLLVIPALLAVAGSGCGITISEINARPAHVYQHKLKFSGRITRSQHLGAETLLELADARGSRILVHTAAPVEAGIDDWVEVEGILVPEARVGDSVLYDVVMAESLKRVRPPRFRNLM
jgi:hypothetical protein